MRSMWQDFVGVWKDGSSIVLKQKDCFSELKELILPTKKIWDGSKTQFGKSIIVFRCGEVMSPERWLTSSLGKVICRITFGGTATGFNQ